MSGQNKIKSTKVLCPYCQSSKTSLYLFVNYFSLYECAHCFLVFTSPQPNARQIIAINEDTYGSLKEKNSRLKIYENEYKRAQKHIKALKKYKKSGKYLDVGCSYGIAVKAAQDMGFNSFGIEPTRKAVLYGRNELKVKIIQTTLEKAKFKNNYFDIITLYDVLEHVPDLGKFLSEIRRILKSKGLLVIQSPNSNSYVAQVLGVDWNWLLIPNHLWHFSARSLSKVLRQQEFSVVNIETEDNIYDFASNFVSKLFMYKNTNTFLDKLLRKIVYLISSITIFVGTIFWSRVNKGGILLVYAIKK